MYKLRILDSVEEIINQSTEQIIPKNPNNRHYQQFLQDVKKEGISIVEGSDVVEPDYVALRTGVDGYASTGEQFGMQTDGTWDAHIAEVKAKFPKTIKGGTTIADVPTWVQEEADKIELQEVI
jgi:hypothetical protein